MTTTDGTGDRRRLGARITDGIQGWTINGATPGPTPIDGAGTTHTDGVPTRDSLADDDVDVDADVDADVEDDVVLRDATELLRAELPDPRLEDDTAYLRWCYRDNPQGRAWERYHYVDGADGEPLLVAHYLIFPRRYRGPGGLHTEGAWSQHAVTRSGYQRERHFTRLGLEIYAEAGAAGRSFVVGVTNHKSTGPVVKYMGWRLVGPLPVRVVLPVGIADFVRRRHRTLRSIEATRDWLRSTDFDHFAATVDRHAVRGWSADWTPDVLRWRLSCPFVRYWVHLADDLAVVTTTTRFRQHGGHGGC